MSESAAKTGWACGLYLCPHQPKCEFREPTDEQPAATTASRECGWCRISYDIWKAVRCIETDDNLVFCSAICLERYEEATGRQQEIASELPFSWDRGDVRCPLTATTRTRPARTRRPAANRPNRGEPR